MKEYLARFLLWLLRKVRGEDPAPTVEPGSRIVFDGVEYACTCAELDPAPYPYEPPLQMFFYNRDAEMEAIRLIGPIPAEMIEITLEYDEEQLKAILEESENTADTMQPPVCTDYSKCYNCLCNDCNPCHRGPVHPCQSCGDKPDPHLTMGQRFQPGIVGVSL